MKRKLIIIIAILILSFTFGYAADKTEYCAADELYVLDLFKGVGTDEYGNPNYDLDSKISREQSVTLLVRLLGKEKEALSKTWETPFDDLSDWARPYIGYAYCNGLTKGVSDNKFGSIDVTSDQQYYTFLLRALGYQEGVDFVWNQSQKLTDQLGITSENYAKLTRGKVCLVSVKALDTNVKGKNHTLLSTIDGITAEQLWHRKYAQIAANNIAEAERVYADAKSKSVKRYNFPVELGKQTLSFDEAEALVGRAPIIVKNRVKTFADVLQYSIAASFGSDNEAFTPRYSEHGSSWSCDWDGEVQLANNWFTCCGGASNYVGYLLDGDYDEEGWIQYWGGGNHHFPWVKKDGKYYIIDLTRYAAGGRYGDVQDNIIVADSIEEFYENKWPSYYASKSEIEQIYYCTDSIGGVPRVTGKGKLIYATDVKDKLTLIYAAPGYTSNFTFKKPDIKIPGYNYYDYVKEENYNEIKPYIEAAEKGKVGSLLKIKIIGGSWDGRIFDSNNIGFGGHNMTIAILYKDKEITDYEFTCNHQAEAPVVKKSNGRLYLQTNNTDLDNSITIKYNDETFTFRWVGEKSRK